MKKRLALYLILVSGLLSVRAQLIITSKTGAHSFPLISSGNTAGIFLDSNDFAVVKKAATLLQRDFHLVTGIKPIFNKQSTNIIIVGSIEKSTLIKKLVHDKKLDISRLEGRWEAYQINTIANPFKGVDNALVIVGSDRRGTAYGIFELSKQIGVSPWYWWADVPVKKKTELYVKKNNTFIDSPKVKYRGIFINDEAPALSNWSMEKFGGFNHTFYSNVFELILRLKGNYLWPAMWGHAFYDDDSLNIKMADEYGVVIGSSHHEPLMRAHDEWRRYGTGKWNYDSNEVKLKEFWKQGMRRASNEKIVSIGMRGDGDEPMTRETATSLLERIVKDQRGIIEEVTGKPANQTPQLWALYKEVQDYYDKGMRVPDDVTLLLCDDNWGNIRKLPKLSDKPRSGGYGIYYHFDYVGDPRNYKWLNTNPIPRVWEQMHLAYSYGVDKIWIVNVGDIKPMEFPISFFLDYAWNPSKIAADDLKKYTQQWAAAQFDNKHAADIADIIATYSKYNGRRKPELLDENTYSIYNYGEAEKVTLEYNNLLAKAEKLNKELPAEYKDAYFQLVLHPVKACANLQELYTNVALNKFWYASKVGETNYYADKAQQNYINDSLITLQYHQIMNGKWNHMMDQTHIGYTYWQQPPFQKIPALKYLPPDSIRQVEVVKGIPVVFGKGPYPKMHSEFSNYVSIEAPHYTKAINSNKVKWKVLPDLGRTGDAITTFPVTAADENATANSPQLQYEFYTYSKGVVKLNLYFSPTLNFHNNPEGLQYAVAIDDEQPQMISINKDVNNQKTWEGWVANNIIIKTSAHQIDKPGKHILKYYMVSSAVILQKLVLDLGGLKESYLGPPETK